MSINKEYCCRYFNVHIFPLRHGHYSQRRGRQGRLFSYTDKTISRNTSNIIKTRSLQSMYGKKTVLHLHQHYGENLQICIGRSTSYIYRTVALIYELKRFLTELVVGGSEGVCTCTFYYYGRPRGGVTELMDKDDIYIYVHTFHRLWKRLFYTT
jgi:hypothetical protein